MVAEAAQRKGLEFVNNFYFGKSSPSLPIRMLFNPIFYPNTTHLHPARCCRPKPRPAMTSGIASSRSTTTLAQSLSRLEISRPTHFPPSSLRPHLQPITQRRHASTPRRTRKLLNLAPAPVLPESRRQHAVTGGSGRSWRPRDVPDGDTIVYNPPSSAPNVYHTPSIFLPRNDPRRKAAQAAQDAVKLIKTEHGTLNQAEGPGMSNLPPLFTKPKEKKHHLTAVEIEEIRRLRQEDETKWTRATLAAKFNCSPFFIAIVVEASEQRRAAVRKAIELRKMTWGPKRTKARLDRQKRRELWKYD